MLPFFYQLNRHNSYVNNYENSVAIIGAGISGLALGSFLKENDISCVIFGKSSNISEYGAGISISPNGKDVLKKIKHS